MQGHALTCGGEGTRRPTL
jgi:hypothetical protein